MIEVGEYVRTRDGQIVKLENNEEIYEDSVDVGIGIIPAVDGIWIDKEYFDYIEKKDIVKHSKNIIDLIEVGDYVNGRLVLQVDYKNKNICLLIPFTDTKANTNIMWYGYEDIKSIVTKEQFAQAEYKIEKGE